MQQRRQEEVKNTSGVCPAKEQALQAVGDFGGEEIGGHPSRQQLRLSCGLAGSVANSMKKTFWRLTCSH